MNLLLFDVSNFGRRLLGSTTLLFSPGNHFWRISSSSLYCIALKTFPPCDKPQDHRQHPSKIHFPPPITSRRSNRSFSSRNKL